MEEYQRKQDASKLKNADSTKKQNKQKTQPQLFCIFLC